MLGPVIWIWLCVALGEEPSATEAILIRQGGEVLRVDAESTEPLLEPGEMAETISLDLVQADLVAVLRLIAEVGGINIVVGDEVSGRVTVRLTDVPWDQALGVILQSKGLMAVPTGAVVVVSPLTRGP